MSRKSKKILTDVLKLLISILAIWFVFSNIDTTELGRTITNVKWGWLFPAVFFFLVSKLISAIRLNLFFRDINVYITNISNIRLYLLGMFYNLFLPGGIGGDGYKIWLLKKKGNQSYRKLTAAVILDRLNGMVALIILALLISILVPLTGKYNYIAAILIPVISIVYWLIIVYLFPYFRKNIFKTTGFSIIVQSMQVLAVIFIIFSLGSTENIVYLIIIFLCSSIVAILPVTIGGMGAREIVFLYGSRYFGIDPSPAIAISLLFFIITAIVSLSGIYYNFRNFEIEIINEDKKNYISGQ